MSDPQPQPQPAAGQPAPSAPPPLATVTTVSPLFKAVLICVFALTLILLALNVALAVFIDNPSDAETDLTQRVQTGWQVGTSAMFGLIGGKALS